MRFFFTMEIYKIFRRKTLVILLGVASEKLGMESRPVTYWPSDLGQFTAPPHLQVRAAYATLEVAGEIRHLSKHHTHP